MIRAQLLLAAKQDPAAVPLELLATYLQLLGRCQWSYSSSGPRATPVPATGSTGPWPGARAGASAAAGAGGGGSSSAAHPSHVRCNVCYQQPLVGVRFRSKRQLGVSVCKGCVGKAAARDAAPYEEVAGVCVPKRQEQDGDAPMLSSQTSPGSQALCGAAYLSGLYCTLAWALQVVRDPCLSDWCTLVACGISK